ncbi:MAG: UDP-3-O-(3-hydroxymyristoyl)glucosamine N-acyltransferase [Gammaproteobacteria bacterium]|jgi:UDP-3-O-[3-hydroxymyristoyl] glucosamine N-acyltransferase|nr:UDP-3-O-(3-hydroxymyristoyl)glucosamine N-acyltransferase [Gammaproteobacteria bacterium]MBU2179576.1 UDP-3-O-(3-hydroxymyristoyl)glucosamine N-acyltransferase [Gammaproteobacteria bacterium]MBU2222658.1 UDP-3-O-(3-hydroxymyristoyl)glucosamine N-acyltransferase [Gammaproteobacteria bacterium]MBU2277208.1 UDP-3-O-(3-hydroxymyristoyl)glucosamine N-acyltransferase [Gammaproteobacteria bacterium]MBU2425978.1 UDP-3-O-(3-hydroxymyristoyl)glucosamine N-acyltransferase [Gammaproteobacteria bacterium
MSVYTLQTLAEQLNAQLHGDGAVEISAVATLEDAQSGQISFLSNAKYRKFLQQTKASAMLIRAEDLEFCPVAALVVKDPYIAFAKVSQLLDTTPAAAKGIHPTAIVDSSAQVDPTAELGPYVVVSKDAVIAAGVQIGAGSFIGEGASIGAGCKVWPQVTIYHRVRVGERCIIHSGVVLGADGFGFANERGQWLKIPQVGTVVIGNDCEIGANTTIDRGAIGDTLIGNNVILDNQIQIAHNVQIGDHSCIAGCTVVAGSTKIGRYCVIGGAVAINGHIEICDGVQITGMTMITKAITEKGIYSSGMPAATNLEWRKNSVRYRQLDQIYQRLRDVEQELAQLRGATDD